MSVFYKLTDLSPEVYEFLLYMAAKGILIFAIAGCINWLLRNASAAVRHIVWVLAFCAVSLLPLLILTVPGVGIPILPAEDITAAEINHLPNAPLASDLPAGMADNFTQLPDMSGYNNDFAYEDDTLASTELAPSPEIAESIAPRPAFSTAQYILLAWAAGIALCLCPVFYRLLLLAVFQLKCQPVKDENLGSHITNICQQLKITSRIKVITNDDNSGRLAPMVWGLHPAVLFLPKGNNTWDNDQTNSVLLHELAHIKRHDWISQLFCSVVCAIYWFNPFTWYALRRLRIEREQACDDLVINSGIDHADYAEHLVGIARKLVRRQPVNSAALAMARNTQIESRIKAILDIRKNRRAVTRVMLAGFTIAVAAVSIPLAAVQLEERKAEDNTKIIQNDENEISTTDFTEVTEEKGIEGLDTSNHTLYFKLPLAQPRYHWKFTDRELYLSGKLVLRISSDKNIDEIIIFDHGKVSDGWTVMESKRGPNENSVYFGFVSTTVYPVKDGDKLELEMIANSDLDGIGRLQTGILKAGTHKAAGKIKIYQADNLQAFISWDDKWQLDITGDKGWYNTEIGILIDDNGNLRPLTEAEEKRLYASVETREFHGYSDVSFTERIANNASEQSQFRKNRMVDKTTAVRIDSWEYTNGNNISSYISTLGKGKHISDRSTLYFDRLRKVVYAKDTEFNLDHDIYTFGRIDSDIATKIRILCEDPSITYQEAFHKDISSFSDSDRVNTFKIVNLQDRSTLYEFELCEKNWVLCRRIAFYDKKTKKIAWEIEYSNFNEPIEFKTSVIQGKCGYILPYNVVRKYYSDNGSLNKTETINISDIAMMDSHKNNDFSLHRENYWKYCDIDNIVDKEEPLIRISSKDKNRFLLNVDKNDNVHYDKYMIETSAVTLFVKELVGSRENPVVLEDIENDLSDKIRIVIDEITKAGISEVIYRTPDGDIDTSQLQLRKNEAKSVTSSLSASTKPFTIYGRVVDVNDNAMEGVEIRANCGMGTLLTTGSTVSEADGSYLLDFGPGMRYMNNDKAEINLQAATIRVEKGGYFEQNLCQQGNLGIAGDAELASSKLWGEGAFKKILLPDEPYKVDFVMAKGAAIEAVVKDANGDPLKEFKLSLKGEKQYPSTSVMAGVTTDDNGKFKLDSIPNKGYFFEHDGKKSEEIKFESGQLYNLDIVYDGKSLKVKSRVETKRTPLLMPINQKGQTYVMKAGDSLQNLAIKHYSLVGYEKYLYEANKAVIDENNGLKSGMEIILPSIEDLQLRKEHSDSSGLPVRIVKLRGVVSPILESAAKKIWVTFPGRKLTEVDMTEDFIQTQQFDILFQKDGNKEGTYISKYPQLEKYFYLSSGFIPRDEKIFDSIFTPSKLYPGSYLPHSIAFRSHDYEQLINKIILAGKVIDKEGNGLPEVRIVQKKMGADMGISYSKADGSFILAGIPIADMANSKASLVLTHPEMFDLEYDSVYDLSEEQRLNLVLKMDKDQAKTAMVNDGSYFSTVSGKVVDESGNGISRAYINVTLRDTKGSPHNYGILFTDADGSFKIADLPLGDSKYKEASFTVSCNGKVKEMVNILGLPEKQKNNLRVVLRDGYTLSGELKCSDGKPAGDVLVELLPRPEASGDRVRTSYLHRRAVRTDSDGSYEIDAINLGSYDLSVMDVVSLQNLFIDEVVIKSNIENFNLRMNAVELEEDIKPVDVLGMKLVNFNRELVSEFMTGTTYNGVLVLDPGVDKERIGVDRLHPGDYIRMVESEPVYCHYDLVMLILKAVSADDYNGKVKLTYGFRNESGTGYGNVFLRLSNEDIIELKRLEKILPKLPKKEFFPEPIAVDDLKAYKPKN